MVAMNPPNSTATADVPKDEVARFEAAGWSKVKTEPKQAPSKRK